MEIVVLLAVVVASIVCYSMAYSINNTVMERYHQGCINWWFAVATAILAVGATVSSDTEVELFIIASITCWVSSVFWTYQKMLRWGATAKEAGLGCLAQAAAAFGIAVAIFCVLLVIYAGSDSRKRRKR